MRQALFQLDEEFYALPLDNILHILTEPRIFRLPLLRKRFSGALLYQEMMIPVMAGNKLAPDSKSGCVTPDFVLICEAECGRVGVPADKILKITRHGEDVTNSVHQTCDSVESITDGRNYLFLELNRIIADENFSLAGLSN